MVPLGHRNNDAAIGKVWIRFPIAQQLPQHLESSTPMRENTEGVCKWKGGRQREAEYEKEGGSEGVRETAFDIEREEGKVPSGGTSWRYDTQQHHSYGQPCVACASAPVPQR